MSSGSPVLSIATQPLQLQRETPVHFVGVGGIGMSGLARLLVENRFSVSGSDLTQNKQTQWLTDNGATIFQGHQESNVPEKAMLIVSSSIDEKNPEIAVALKRAQPIFHRSDLLREIFQGPLFNHQHTIGISGTHGKTTITGMCAVALDGAGLDPTVIVGGQIPKWQTNAKLGQDRNVAVAELDESDGSIVQYTPDFTVISNLELDHADHYQDGLAAIRSTFSQYLGALKPGSTVVFSLDCPETLALSKTLSLSGPEGIKKIFYSASDLSLSTETVQNLLKENQATAIYWLKNIRHHGFGAYQGYAYRQDNHRSQLMGELHLTLPGLHNLSNALSVIAVGDQLDAPFEAMANALREFTGMGRRFEKLGELPVDGGIVKVYDDYAHHPTEVKATLKAAADLVKSNNGRVFAIFQPHRYTRLQALWNEFCTCFSDASQVVITDIYPASESPIEGIDAEQFVLGITQPGAIYLPLQSSDAEQPFDGIRQYIQQHAKAGDIVLSMGAGNITQLFRNWPALT